MSSRNQSPRSRSSCRPSTVRVLGATVAALALAADLSGQSISAAASRWLTDPRVVDYRVSVSSYRTGPIALFPFVQLTSQAGSADPLAETAMKSTTLGGVGADASVRLSAAAQPYLLVGASGGFIDFDRTLGLGLWRAWSVGVGYELLRLGTAGIGIELRYQQLSRQATGGVSLGVRIGKALGGAAERLELPAVRPATSSPLEPAERPPLATVAAGSTARTVLDAALDAMGTPYRWGGSDSNGFDCSGLIQFAYARGGVAVPRRSADQARFGRPIGTEPGRLAPGDILVFSSEPGGSVTHVGLYLGEDRFIHSATGGTQISRLTRHDPTGRWWYDRWIDSRRPLE